jgi:hypothetical protein
MTTLQAMLIGTTLAWTPSLLVLACILRDIHLSPDEELDKRGGDPGYKSILAVTLHGYHESTS